MSGDTKVHVAELILAALARIERSIDERFSRVERQLADQADDLDALDRGLRPYGDGSRPGRRPRG